MANHTPGPWKLLVVGTQWGIVPANAKRDTQDICMGSQDHDGNWKADTALIKAAPDMLAALQSIADITNDPAVRKLALATIKKASA